jgi:hypothetical protein
VAAVRTGQLNKFRVTWFGPANVAREELFVQAERRQRKRGAGALGLLLAERPGRDGDVGGRQRLELVRLELVDGLLGVGGEPERLRVEGLLEQRS